jgi:hypothetical protein
VGYSNPSQFAGLFRRISVTVADWTRGTNDYYRQVKECRNMRGAIEKVDSISQGEFYL